MYLGLSVAAFGCAPELNPRDDTDPPAKAGGAGQSGSSFAGAGGKTSASGGAYAGGKGLGGRSPAGGGSHAGGAEKPTGGESAAGGRDNAGGGSMSAAGSVAELGGTGGAGSSGMSGISNSGASGGGSGGTPGSAGGGPPSGGSIGTGGKPSGGAGGSLTGGAGGKPSGGAGGALTGGAGGKPSAGAGGALGGGAVGGDTGGVGGDTGGASGGAGGRESQCQVEAGTRLMENLGRGMIAIETASGVYLGWRFLGTDPDELAFNIYRGADLLTETPITDSTNYLDSSGDSSSSYTLVSVIDGLEQGVSAEATPLAENYISIPLDASISQGANLVGVGDLDGDGEFEIVVKRASEDIDPGSGTWTRSTDTFKLEAYDTDGTFLWRVDLGPNIEQGIWYSPFTVFDLDGDGRAEVIAKMAERLDEDLNQDGMTDYRNAAGRVDAGPEYLAVIDGRTGAIRARTDWIPRGTIGSWGDTYGNRVNRNLMGIAYLDGQRPSLVMFRGTYALMKAEAWNYRDGELYKVWDWSLLSGGGYHNIRVGDIDADGKDEIVNGSIAMDDDGKTMWVHGEGHGDRLHMTDIDPSRPGLEIFYVQETSTQHVHHVRDALTGALLWGSSGYLGDNGRGNCGDVVGNRPGLECWSARVPGLYDATGGLVSNTKPASINFSIWWDGDVLRELMDSNHVDKYGGGTLMLASGCTPGSRLAPMGYADILGDWREEVLHLCGNSIRIYTTTSLTDVRQYTLMHDSDYRTSVAAETMGYMQSTQPSFYFGAGMAPPPTPRISTQCLAPEP